VTEAIGTEMYYMLERKHGVCIME